MKGLGVTREYEDRFTITGDFQYNVNYTLKVTAVAADGEPRFIAPRIAIQGTRTPTRDIVQIKEIGHRVKRSTNHSRQCRRSGQDSSNRTEIPAVLVPEVPRKHSVPAAHSQQRVWNNTSRP